jgi:pyruvate/2-oxoglutarate dehydrogenase complex dihydrolipoamide dehydrogenase (E3) component
MADYDFDLGVIGGGAAGLTVTSGAAQLGAKTLLIEKEGVLGGDCLHFGCVPSKTLIRTAHVYHLIKNSRRFGLPGVDIPSVDFTHVAKRIRSVISVIQKHDSEERFCGLGAKVVWGEPSFADEHSVRLKGRTYSARAWVIATGTSPAIPPIEGLKETPYLTNRELFSLERLPRSMIVLGGGAVAVEMAQAFNRLGTEVSVIQRSNQILSKEDKDMADIVMEVLTGEGVRFYLKSTVLHARDLGEEREVAIKTEAGETLSLRTEAGLPTWAGWGWKRSES